MSDHKSEGIPIWATRSVIAVSGATIAFAFATTLFAPLQARAAVAGSVALPAPLADADFLHDGTPPEALVELGRALFFDPILSGNRNISCGTCVPIHEYRVQRNSG